MKTLDNNKNQSITTIEALARKLDNAKKEERGKIIRKLDLLPDSFQEFATWSNEGYTRNCILRTDDYELLLLCWDREAETPIHGHGGQDCWVYQIEGTVNEVRLKPGDNGILKQTHSCNLKPGEISYMNDGMGVHKIVNPAGQRAMTLHIYAKPIDACRVFDPKKRQFEIKEMKYDHVVNS